MQRSVEVGILGNHLKKKLLREILNPNFSPEKCLEKGLEIYSGAVNVGKDIYIRMTSMKYLIYILVATLSVSSILLIIEILVNFIFKNSN